MARLHYNVIPWGNKYDGPNYYKDGRRGALDDALWDEDELVDYRRFAKRKKVKKARKGCPGNDNGPHVYVWVEVKRYRVKWTGTGFVNDRSRPLYTINQKTCCGCLKVTNSVYDWEKYYG